jgi:hypothetical protein
VQKAVARILEAIYEQDFLDCSYGYRPNRSCHQALNVVDKMMMRRPINYVVEADIKRFLDPSSYYTPFHEDWLKSVCWSSNTCMRKPLRLPRQI